MNICERDLVRAVDVFMREAAIPRPSHWTVAMDGLFLRNRIYPAFLAALETIEPVARCHGFSLEGIERHHNELEDA